VGRCPEDKHAQVFFDAVKSVVNSSGDENEAAWPDRPVLFGDSNRGAPAHHVIDLVLQVRMLAIGRPLGPDRQADAQLVGGEEVDVAVAFGVTGLRIKRRNLVSFHGYVRTTTR